MFASQQEVRTLVPQWRRFAPTASTSELAMPPRIAAAHRRMEPDLIKRIERFRQEPGLVTAADLVESAVVLGHDSEAVMAARVVLRGDAVPLVRVQAERLMLRTGHGEELEFVGPEEQSPQPVAWRARTRVNPADAFAWIELALVQFCRGHVAHAVRSMTVALQLAPGNRHVLRAAARLFFQIGDFDRAHDLLRRNDGTPGDPWLMAAEVALSTHAERKPAFMKQGQALAESQSLAPSQVTELAGAIGTRMILDGGGGRLARKLMRQSQQAPTVNAVAQAEWVSLNRGVSVEESPAMQARRHAWEAMYLHSFFIEGHLEKALGCAQKWMEDEPYNHLAYASVAATANVMLDFETSKRTSKLGLAVAQGSEPLLNTLAFALACTDDLQGAETYLSKVRHVAGGHQSLVAVANRGLIAMRRGRTESAKELYSEAISGFRRADMRELEASALSYFGYELARAGEAEESRLRLKEARKINEQFKRRYIERIAMRAEHALETAVRVRG